MARKWLGSFATLLAGAGLVWGQAATPPVPPTPPPAQTPPSGNIQQTSAVVTPAAALVPRPVDPAPSRGSMVLTQPDADQSRFWFQAEYLLWWVRPGSLPPVVGTAPTAQVATGVLATDSINPLFGNNSNTLNYHEQSGLRLNFGLWLDNSQEWGFDASFFQLEQKTAGSTFASNGDPVIGPIFFDPTTNSRNIILASEPNFASGPLANLPRTATIEGSANNRLWSAEANLRKQIGAVFFADHLDLLVGFRHMQFSEGINIVTDSESGPGSVQPTTLHIEDHLGVLNQFYGPQIGLASHTQVGRWSFDAIAKLAMGDMHEISNINGSTLLITPSTTIASNTGVLAEPTNTGRPSRDRFAVMPELTLNVGYQVVENVIVTVGYNFLYVNSMMRTGDLVDGVDARQVRSLSSYDPNAQATRPQFQQHDSRFWAEGVNVGLEFRY